MSFCQQYSHDGRLLWPGIAAPTTRCVLSLLLISELADCSEMFRTEHSCRGWGEVEAKAEVKSASKSEVEARPESESKARPESEEETLPQATDLAELSRAGHCC